MSRTNLIVLLVLFGAIAAVASLVTNTTESELTNVQDLSGVSPDLAYPSPNGDSGSSTSDVAEETLDLPNSAISPPIGVVGSGFTRDPSINVSPLVLAGQIYENDWSDFVENLDLPELEERRVREMIVRHYALNREALGQYRDDLIDLAELFSMILTSHDLERQLSSVLSPAQLDLYWEHDSQLNRQFDVNREQIGEAFVDAGYTGILAFSNVGDWDTVQAYIDAGADVNMRPAGGESSPLHNAISHGSIEMVRALVDAGADVNWRDGDSITSPLKWAASRGNVEIIQELVAAGADLEYHTPGIDQATALTSAVLSGREDAVRELLRLGADATGGAGTMALDAATRSGNQEIQQALIDAGASID